MRPINFSQPQKNIYFYKSEPNTAKNHKKLLEIVRKKEKKALKHQNKEISVFKPIVNEFWFSQDSQKFFRQEIRIEPFFSLFFQLKIIFEKISFETRKSLHRLLYSKEDSVSSGNKILQTKISPPKYILLFPKDNFIDYFKQLELLNYKRSKIAFNYFPCYKSPIIQIEFAKVSKIIVLYIFFDFEESFFFDCINIIKTCNFEINDIVNASGFMKLLKNSNGVLEDFEETSQSLSSQDPCVYLTHIINVLIHKIFESDDDDNLFKSSEKLLEIEYKFFMFLRDLSPEFSIEKTLQNPNIHKLSLFYNSQMLPQLKIFQNYKLLEVKLETNHLYSQKKMKVSLVYLLPQIEKPKTLELVIRENFSKFWSEIDTMIDFFSVNFEPIIAILQKYQSPKLQPLSFFLKLILSVGDLDQFFTFKYSHFQDLLSQQFYLNNHEFRSSWKCFNKKNQVIRYHFHQNVKVEVSDIFSILISLFRENYKFILLSFWFTLGIFYDDREQVRSDNLKLKFFLKINLMMRRFLYFFQKIKTKKRSFKLRNEIFKEIYNSMIEKFEAKLDSYLGLRIPSHKLPIEQIYFDTHLFV